MKTFKDILEKITQEEINYTKGFIGSYIMYNYSFKKNKSLLCTLKMSENILHIELLILPEDLRKKGYGSLIVSNLKEWAFQNDYQLIELVSIHSSKVFWEKQGFKTINNNINKMVYYINSQ